MGFGKQWIVSQEEEQKKLLFGHWKLNGTKLWKILLYGWGWWI